MLLHMGTISPFGPVYKRVGGRCATVKRKEYVCDTLHIKATQLPDYGRFPIECGLS